MVDLFKKKMSPAELVTKISISEKKLEKREGQIKDKRDKAREEAKNALKNGDERGFRVASKQYGSAAGQLNTVSSMLEMSSTMRNALEDQESLTEIVEIGKDLAFAQKSAVIRGIRIYFLIEFIAPVASLNEALQKTC